MLALLVLVLVLVGPPGAGSQRLVGPSGHNGSPALGVGDARDPQELPFAMVDDGDTAPRKTRTGGGGGGGAPSDV